MAPKDPTPLGDEMARSMPEPQFPEPKPGQESDEPVRGRPVADESESAPETSERPPLPDRPKRMVADLQDPETDPDTGPGTGEAPRSLNKQRG